MKTLFLFLLITTCSLAKAQKDPCKDVKTTYDEFKKQTKYSTPYISGKVNIQLFKLINDQEVAKSLVVSFDVASSDYNIKEAFIKFDDGTILKASNLSAESKYYGSGQYSCIAVMDIDDELMDKLKTQRIIKLKVGNDETDVYEKTSVKIVQLASCIFKAG